MVNANSFPAAGAVVSTNLEDWGDDDRRLMLLNVYHGRQSIALFDTFAEVKAFCAEHGYTIAQDNATTPRINTSNKIVTIN